MFGCYEAKNDNLIIYYNIQLRADSTYCFSNKGDIYEATQQGRWMLKNNKLILNSNIQPKTKGYFKETQDSTQKKFQFILFDIDGKPLAGQHHVYVKQNSDYLPLTPLMGNIYLIDKSKLHDNYYVGIGTEFQEVQINAKNPGSNTISVYLVPDTKGLFEIKFNKFEIKDSLSFISKTLIFRKTN